MTGMREESSEGTRYYLAAQVRNERNDKKLRQGENCSNIWK